MGVYAHFPAHIGYLSVLVLALCISDNTYSFTASDWDSVVSFVSFSTFHSINVSSNVSFRLSLSKLGQQFVETCCAYDTLEV